MGKRYLLSLPRRAQLSQRQGSRGDGVRRPPPGGGAGENLRGGRDGPTPTEAPPPAGRLRALTAQAGKEVRGSETTLLP